MCHFILAPHNLSAFGLKTTMAKKIRRKMNILTVAKIGQKMNIWTAVAKNWMENEHLDSGKKLDRK